MWEERTTLQRLFPEEELRVCWLPMVATMMGVLVAKAESRGSDGKEGRMGSWVHGEQQCSEPRPGGLPLGGPV